MGFSRGLRSEFERKQLNRRQLWSNQATQLLDA